MTVHGNGRATIEHAVSRAIKRVRREGLKKGRSFALRPRKKFVITEEGKKTLAAFKAKHGIDDRRSKMPKGGLGAGGKKRKVTMPVLNLPPMPEDE